MMKKILLSLLICCIAFAQYNGVKPIQGTQIDRSNPLSKGLIGYWLAGHGGNRAYDLSGNGNDGTYEDNTYLIPGKFGQAWSMDGVDDVIQCGNNSIFSFGTSPYTIVAWVNKDASKNSAAGIVAFGPYDPTWVVDQFGYMYIYDGGNKADGTNVVVSGQWNQLVWVRRSTGANDTHYYMNSFKDTTTVTHSESIAVSTGVVIGTDRVETSVYDFKGYIDSVMIYNRALTEDEIRQLYIDPYCIFRQEQPEMYVAAGEAPAGQVIIVIMSGLPLLLIIGIVFGFMYRGRENGQSISIG